MIPKRRGYRTASQLGNATHGVLGSSGRVFADELRCDTHKKRHRSILCGDATEISLHGLARSKACRLILGCQGDQDKKHVVPNALQSWLGLTICGSRSKDQIPSAELPCKRHSVPRRSEIISLFDRSADTGYSHVVGVVSPDAMDSSIL